MESRFAREYLNNSSSLKQLTTEICDLAKRSHISVDGLDIISEALDQRLSILILGNSDIGRDQILDNLLGTKVSDLLSKENSSAIQFRKKDAEFELPLTVKHKKDDSLADLLCIHGTSFDTISEAKTKELQACVNYSDISIWVISITDPWSSVFWDFLEQQTPETIQQSIIVLNHVERLSPSDLQTMSQHLRNLMLERLNKTLQIYTLQGEDNGYTGYAELWEKTNSLLNNLNDRNIYLDRVKSKLERVLDLLEQKVDDRRRALDSDKGFLSSIESDISRLCQREILLLTNDSTSLSIPYTEETRSIKEKAKKAFSSIPSSLNLFLPAFAQYRLDQEFTENVISSYLETVEKNLNKILLDCRQEWKKMHGHLVERLGVNAGEFKEEGFFSLKENILEKQESHVREALNFLRVKSVFDQLIFPRTILLKKIIIIFLSSLILTGLLGTFNIASSPIPAFIFLIISVCIYIFYFYKVYSTRSTLCDELEDRLSSYQLYFSDQMKEPYREMIQTFFSGYAPMFIEMKSQIASSRSSLEPIQKEHKELYLKLIAINLEK